MDDNGVNPGLPKPRLVLRVGVAGTLRLDNAQERALAATSAEISRVIAVEMAASLDQPGMSELFSGDAPVLRVVSSLAAGVDQVFAEAALDPGDSSVDCDLHCVFPFPTQVYRDGSIMSSVKEAQAVSAAERFDRLADRAEHILELDGEYSEGESGAQARRRAYRAGAWFLCQQSDVLVAAFDAEAGGAAGGTAETVKNALRAEIPVVWIDIATAADADGRLPVRLISSWRELESPSEPGEWHGDLRALVRGLICLPGDGHGGERSDDMARQAIAEFYSGEPPRKGYRIAVWKNFMKLIAGGLSKPSPAVPVEPYETYRKRAGALSGSYTNRYRGAFLLNFILLALLVLLVAGFESVLAVGGTPIWLAALKLGLIGYIYWNAFSANSRRWHKRGIDYRVLAELLRSSNYLAPLGVASPRSRLPVQYALNELKHSWAIWLFRSMVRAEPIVSTGEGWRRVAALDGAALKRAREGITGYWLQGQIEHHHGTAATMGRMFNRLEGIGRLLIRLMLVAAVLQTALEIYCAATGAEGGIAAAGRWLVFIGAVAPAVVASCAGVVYQSEARRLADRSQAMAGQLEEWKGAILATGSHPHGCDCWLAARDALQIAQVIADEVADWHMLHQPHEVSAV